MKKLLPARYYIFLKVEFLKKVEFVPVGDQAQMMEYFAVFFFYPRTWEWVNIMRVYV